MQKAQGFYCNINQGLGKKPFVEPHKPSFKALDRLIEILDSAPRPRIFGAGEVAKQEFWSNFFSIMRKGENVLKRIKDGARFEHVSYAREFGFPGVFELGNALFSDLPIDEQQVSSYPQSFWSYVCWEYLIGSRNFMLHKIRHAAGSLYVLLTHMTWSSPSQRRVEAEFVNRIARRLNGPVLFLLDANCPPVYVPERKRYHYKDGDWLHDDHRRDKTTQLLSQQFVDLAPGSGLKSGCAGDTRQLYTFRYRIIDYVLGKNLPSPTSYDVVQEAVSDHRLIHVELPLPAAEASCDGIERLLIPRIEPLPYDVARDAKELYTWGKTTVQQVKKIMKSSPSKMLLLYELMQRYW